MKASIVVFLVALPLNLGVALASDAPLSSGIISGIVGGIVIGLLSGSKTSVSGPAAGLSIIVVGALQRMNFPTFLTSVVLGGLFQVILGALRVGWLSSFFPTSVVKGMLAAIGLVIILKEIPYLLGVDHDVIEKINIFSGGISNDLSELLTVLSNIKLGSVIIGLIAILILIIWNYKKFRENKKFAIIAGIIPGPLAVVLLGVTLKLIFDSISGLKIEKEYLVALPVVNQIDKWFMSLPSPDWQSVWQKDVWVTAATMAVIASLETLLSIEALDKIDTEGRITPKNQELLAQGTGNILTGFLGGIPISAVVVRSSANLDAGCKTKLSTILHGCFILLSALFLASLINQIPLASLAAILLFTGYKLSRPVLYRSYIRIGKNQFIPFVVTIVSILITDLLIGMAIGLLIGIYFILRAHYHTPFKMEYDLKEQGISEINDPKSFDESYDGNLESIPMVPTTIYLGEIISFLNKAHFKDFLYSLPQNSIITINGKNTRYLDHDVLEMIYEFKAIAPTRNIKLKLKSLPKYRKTYS